MDVFRIFADMTDGTQQQIADGSGDNVLSVGDELETGGLVLKVYRRRFVADAQPPEFHLFVKRVS